MLFDIQMTAYICPFRMFTSLPVKISSLIQVFHVKSGLIFAILKLRCFEILKLGQTHVISVCV
jgi:hypothetical protein